MAGTLRAPAPCRSFSIPAGRAIRPEPRPGSASVRAWEPRNERTSFHDSRNARDLIGGQAGFFDDDQELPQNLPGGLLGLDGRELANAEFIIRARALGFRIESLRTSCRRWERLLRRSGGV